MTIVTIERLGNIARMELPHADMVVDPRSVGYLWEKAGRSTHTAVVFGCNRRLTTVNYNYDEEGNIFNDSE